MTSTENSTKKTEQAKKPFNDLQSSDTIFRTSDGIDFYVHRIVLFLASPFFRDIFSLPQPSSTTETKPVVDVTEPSAVLDPLLRLCYPVDDPEFPESNTETLALIGNTLEAALKYQLLEATKILKGHLRSFCKGHPLHAYAIACRLQLEKEASLAAHRWKEVCPARAENHIIAKGCYMDWKDTISSASYVLEMANISAGAYYRLLQYIRNGTKTTFSTPPKSESPSQDNLVLSDTIRVSEEFNFPDYDVSILSSDNVEFRVHQLILRLVSPTLAERIKSNVDEKKQLLLPDNSLTISILLAICYPGTELDDLDMSLAYPIISAAQKYNMKPKVQKAVKALLMAHADTDPLRVYLAFARNGLLEDAANVARTALFQKPLMELFTSEMEDISAEVYYQLLEYRHQCLSCVTRICAKYETDSSSSEVKLDWWHILPNHTVPTPKSLTLASPVVQRQLMDLQNECRSYYPGYYKWNDSYHRREPSQVQILQTGVFNLRKVYNESKKLQEELDTTLSNLKIKSANDTVYKPEAADLSNK